MLPFSMEEQASSLFPSQSGHHHHHSNSGTFTSSDLAEFMPFASFAHSFSLPSREAGSNDGASSSLKMQTRSLDEVMGDLSEDPVVTVPSILKDSSHLFEHDSHHFSDFLPDIPHTSGSGAVTSTSSAVGNPSPSTAAALSSMVAAVAAANLAADLSSSSPSPSPSTLDPIPPPTPSFSEKLLSAAGSATALSTAPAAAGYQSAEDCCSPRVPHFRGFSAIFQEPSTSSLKFHMTSPTSTAHSSISALSMATTNTSGSAASDLTSSGVFLSDQETCMDLLSGEEREPTLLVPQLSTSSSNASPTSCLSPTTPHAIKAETNDYRDMLSSAAASSAVNAMPFGCAQQLEQQVQEEESEVHTQYLRHPHQHHNPHAHAACSLDSMMAAAAAASLQPTFPATSAADMALEFEVIEDTATTGSLEDYSRWLFNQGGQYASMCDDTFSCQGSEADSWVSNGFYSNHYGGEHGRQKKSSNSPPRVRKHVGDMTPQELEKARKQGRMAARRNRAIRKARWEQQLQESEELKKRNMHLQAIAEKLRPQILRLRQQVFLKFQQEACKW